MLEEIVEPLVTWYRKRSQILPWRQQENPYYIWISEGNYASTDPGGSGEAVF